MKGKKGARSRTTLFRFPRRLWPPWTRFRRRAVPFPRRQGRCRAVQCGHVRIAEGHGLFARLRHRSRFPLHLQGLVQRPDTFPNEMSEVALAHTVSDKVEAAYRRGNMVERRRQMMEAWAKYAPSRPLAVTTWWRSAGGNEGGPAKRLIGQPSPPGACCRKTEWSELRDGTWCRAQVKRRMLDLAQS